jgi:UDP-GlcNAc:undecaprenyl-phosphate/decaprenyl-phosphate GlcNAc-1-phosphate transferase
MTPLFLLIVSAALSMAVIPVAWRLAPRLGLVDLPDPRKVHQLPVPRVGGWGIALGCLLPLALTFKLDPLLQSFMIANLLLFAFGIWDDARQINHWAKFSGQFLAAGVIVYYGGLYVVHVPFLDEAALPPALGQAFTVIAMVGMINAINHSDGLDGLAGGESMLSLIAIAILGSLTDDSLMAGIALATIGGTLGFLRFNSHPARVFMGDGGSQFLGLTLGFLAVYLTQRAATAMSPALPLLLFGVPVSDIIAVLYQRVSGGMNWFRATRNHLHHRLLDLGFSHFETVVIIYSAHAALVAAALLLRFESDLVLSAVFAVAIGALYVTVITAERRGWRLRSLAPAPERRSAAWLQYFRSSPRIEHTLLLLIAGLIPLFTLLGAVAVANIPRDFAIMAGALAVVLAAALLFSPKHRSLLVRAVVYVTAIFASYLTINQVGLARAWVPDVALILIILLAIAIGIYVRLRREQSFATTPTDFLIVFCVLTMMILGGINYESRATVNLAVFAIVLLYGCELVAARVSARREPLPLAALLSLSILFVRGISG